MNHLTDETLNEYLDNEVANRADVDEHLSQCADCAARLASLQALFNEIESLPELTLSRDIAAPFTRRDAGFVIPNWLKLTATLQAIIAIVSLLIAAPFVMNLFPVVALPSLMDIFVEIQAQWLVWFDALSKTQLPALPEYSLSFEFSSLFLTSALAGLFVLWIVGNGLLLRNQINKRRIP